MRYGDFLRMVAKNSNAVSEEVTRQVAGIETKF
jgi:hypothetical protein